MRGLGKTTLAQLVYNDPRIDKSFSLKVWVCFSHGLNIEQMVRNIVISAPPYLRSHNDVKLLKHKLAGKKFFLVLDNVWNEDPLKWHELRNLIPTGIKESYPLPLEWLKVWLSFITWQLSISTFLLAMFFWMQILSHYLGRLRFQNFWVQPKALQALVQLLADMDRPGSFGFIPPEYEYMMQVTTLVNVYSYGVVLLEIFTTRQPVEEDFGEGVDLVKWVLSAPIRGKLLSRYPILMYLKHSWIRGIDELQLITLNSSLESGIIVDDGRLCSNFKVN
ncbi:hypothetical protein RIF29_39422 [Crotalaria pallida]|uniref:NB-ARC domain-containing protein n=1 Tax=Crotalaria pallida TaxID=3830 RepID=A0AAN9E471_CROPI